MKSRPYTMTARATTAQQTHQRILQAGAALFWEQLSLEITLDDVAARAGVSVQTVLRHFGTRDGLFDALEAFAQQEIIAERQAPAGDIPAAVAILFDHYEARGDAVLRLLGQEFWDERIRAITEHGRHTHRAWVELVFAPRLAARPPAAREALIDLLVVATDIYTWKLLRRDRALERSLAEERVRQLIGVIMESNEGGSR
jgi:AcrR family transcriptional regulator